MFFFKQKTAYEMRISDWSSDVCSSDLWVLVRYRFPGKRLVDALVDLPFALPTAVAGIALTSLYAPNGWIGHYLTQLGIQVAFTPLGVVVAVTFVSLPDRKSVV